MRPLLPLLCLVGCAASQLPTPPSPAPTPTAPTPTAPTPTAPVAVALDVDVFGPDGGAPIGHVDRGLVVERREGEVRMAMATSSLLVGEYVRIQSGATTLEGVVPLERTKPGHGIGLFATADTPVTAASGKPLGSLARGAFVPVVRFDGDAAVVALAPFRVEGRVPRSALGFDRSGPPREESLPRKIENRELAVETAAGRVVTLCHAPVFPVSEAGSRVRVKQTVLGVTVEGDASDVGTACRPRVVARRKNPDPKVPEGWTALPKTPIATFGSDRALFRIDTWSETPSCQKMAFHRRPSPRIVIVRKQSTLLEDVPYVDTTTYAVSGAGPRLPGPTVLTLPWLSTVNRDLKGGPVKGIGEGIALCGEWTVLAVDETKEGLRVLDGVSDADIVAFHPADAELWYTDAAACERALAPMVAKDLAVRLLAFGRPKGC